MDTKLKQAIVEAKHYVYQIHDCCHNSVHVEAVVSFAERIAKNHPGVRKDVVEVAAWWHDVGRLYSEDHEEISASMAQKALRKIGRNFVMRFIGRLLIIVTVCSRIRLKGRL